ncbi:MAG: hypothetical protein AB4058_13015 [Microcystaceae cyanobacterium]
MTQKGIIHCFYADSQVSSASNSFHYPDWLSIETNWQGYRIATIPWVADVARLLGILPIDDTPEGWQTYLEQLGFQKVTPVCCEVFYEDKLYS